MKKLITICLLISIAFISNAQERYEGLNGKWGLKLNDKIILEPKYDRIYALREGIAIVELEKKYGFIDSIGKEIIEIKYNWVSIFNDGLARVVLDYRYGYIDIKGTLIIENKYEEASDFQDGLAKVLYSGKWGLIDKTGKTIVEPQYNSIDSFKNGLARVSLRYSYDKFVYGYIDKTGNEIIKCIYTTINEFDGGFIVAWDYYWCVYDTTGKEIIEISLDMKYENITYKDGFLYVKLRGSDKVLKFDKQGKLIE